MFMHTFTKRKEAGRRVEFEGTSYTIGYSYPNLVIEYNGRSFKDVISNIELDVIPSEDEDQINIRRKGTDSLIEDIGIKEDRETTVDDNSSLPGITSGVITTHEESTVNMESNAFRSGSLRFSHAFSLGMSIFQVNLETEFEIKLIDENSNFINHTVQLNITHGNNKPLFSGLDNFGATCYINTFLQSIYHIKELRYILYNSSGYYSKNLSRLFYAMELVSMNLHDGSMRTVDGDESNSAEIHNRLSHFVHNFSFVSCIHEHQDIHEFSKYLLDALEIENKDEMKKLQEGTIESTMTKSCGCVSKSKEKFQDIQLLVRDMSHSYHSVYESLQEFTKAIEIEELRCEEHGVVSATKKVQFEHLPKVLFLLISRFAENYEYGTYVKLNDRYEFPETLNLSEFSIDSQVDYKLHSVMVHSGDVGSGHYYCYINIKGKYYKFDDETVFEVAKSEALQGNYGGKGKRSSGYYLVYLRGDMTTENSSEVDISKSFSLFQQNIEFDLSPDILSFLRKPLNKMLVNYFTSNDIMSYTGPGIFNLNNPDYPLTPIHTVHCNEMDCSYKIFRNKTVYDSKFTSVSVLKEDEVYYVTPGSQVKSKGTKRIFLKRFTPSNWCNYPKSMYSLGDVSINSLDDIRKFTDCDNYHLVREHDMKEITVFQDICQFDGIVLIGCSFDKVVHNCIDVFIEFYKRYLNHYLLNISIDSQNIPVFMERYYGCNMCQEGDSSIDEGYISDGPSSINERSVSELNTKICVCNNALDNIKEYLMRYFHSNNFTIESYTINTMELSINQGSLYHVGVVPEERVPDRVKLLKQNSDPNLIDHLHQFIMPLNSTAGDLIKKYKTSTTLCHKCNDLDIVLIRSWKESCRCEIMKYDDLLLNGAYYVMQSAISHPITVCYYKNNFQLINYPFLLENPLNEFGMRKTYFFANRIVRLKNGSYEEVDEINDGDVILVETR